MEGRSYLCHILLTNDPQLQADLTIAFACDLPLNTFRHRQTMSGITTSTDMVTPPVPVTVPGGNNLTETSECRDIKGGEKLTECYPAITEIFFLFLKSNFFGFVRK